MINNMNVETTTATAIMVAFDWVELRDCKSLTEAVVVEMVGWVVGSEVQTQSENGPCPATLTIATRTTACWLIVVLEKAELVVVVEIFVKSR
jgi:hypothetical protein